jgi:hypothetical protein
MRQIYGTRGEFRYSGSNNVAPSDRNLPVLLTVVKYCQVDDASTLTHCLGMGVCQTLLPFGPANYGIY